jgi:hypothetical protein
MEWISVKKRWPDEFVEVLASCKALKGNPSFEEGERFFAVDSVIPWQRITPSFRTNLFNKFAEVTHWMPLPAPPRE